MSFFSFFNNKSEEENEHDVILLSQENAQLRKQIKHQSYQLEAFKLINKITASTTRLLNLDEIYALLSKTDFESIGISLFLLAILQDNKFVSVSHFGISPEDTDTIIEAVNQQFDEFKSMERILTTDELVIKNQQLISLLSSLGIVRTSIAPVKFENEFIGILILGISNSFILPAETINELCQALSAGIAIIHNYAYRHKESMIEKKELEEKILSHIQQLKQQIDTVNQISREKTEFISTVSHELRTSLTSIHGFAKLIAQGKLGELPPEASTRIDKIISQTEKLVQMVNILLDINRIESRKVKMNFANVNLHENVTSVIDTFLGQLQEKHIKLTLNIPHEINIYADPVYIERVFSNLISNAIKFTPEHGEIEISAKEIKSYIHITVKDTGIGISKEHIDNIFKDFYHIDHPDLTNIRGIGLGLSLVKRIIDAHNGDIRVESDIGKGTSFHIKLEKGK